MRNVSSWGLLSASPHQVIELNDSRAVAGALNKFGPGIAYGVGRSYGDVDLNPGGTLWDTHRMDRFISFDEETGILTCEAGLLLRDILDVTIPRGWKLPVTPGTQFVTVGGAIANDVHGKNHHSDGTFGDHVRRMTLLRTDGQVIECGPDLEKDWFAATVGGLGLTGVVIEAEIALQRVAGPWIDAEDVVFESLEEFFALSDDSEEDWQHSVSWVDCTTDGGRRGIFSRGNTAETTDKAEPRGLGLTVPITPPFSLVNSLTLRPFNIAYFHLKKARAHRGLVHYRPFFYPLDGIQRWNRIYGPKGFFQYQSVVPREQGEAAVQEMLKQISASGTGSFLGVLKTFGDRLSAGMMSFPEPGVTLAIDFPNLGDRSERLFKRLDAIVREAGGRLYPGKDARMSREMFEEGYPRLQEFLPYRDPGISSEQSRRLMGS